MDFKVNLKDIIDDEDFEQIIRNKKFVYSFSYSIADNSESEPKEVCGLDIYNLAKDNKELAKIFLDIDIHLSSYDLVGYSNAVNKLIDQIDEKTIGKNFHTLNELVNVFAQIQDHSEKFKSIINDLVVDFTLKQTAYYSKQILNMLKMVEKHLTTENKKIIYNYFIDNSYKFGASRKNMISMLSNYDMPYDDTVRFVRKFNRSMSMNMFKNIVDKVPDGMNDQHIKTILSSNKKLQIDKFSKDDLKDAKKRKKLIRHIVKTPTSESNLDFNIKITLSDLQGVAPSMRFDFLRWYFNGPIDYIRSRRYYMRSYYFQKDNMSAPNLKKRIRAKNIIIDDISPDDITKLLLSVGIKKNSIVSIWIEKYKIYHEIIKNGGLNESLRDKIYNNWPSAY